MFQIKFSCGVENSVLYLGFSVAVLQVKPGLAKLLLNKSTNQVVVL